MPVFVACSTFGAANGSAFTGGRYSLLTSYISLYAPYASYVLVNALHTPREGSICSLQHFLSDRVYSYLSLEFLSIFTKD